ncbi:phosphoserine phosphatase SerB (plasmid) [Deinococcus proteolyticus MRP]|uniref:phosphoserine phosphatase n=1 Tax=Deinococcus proteolyticus (strain ATCC 35074 / DSM 20540 / JCM 6276 / NBRC 101906 / NCIMB 13154 / VKM Ac-1939 / CCM 2703 / MRP) TaxID=693977 RepID=F0RQW3_DEIPM|nr:phosphoserine phosphatase SerB [Deinococcus proteolyticus]ADY27672.1 phosphoserine phosphatase SerB [Deinococcus proteolyticus MRP]
MYTATLLTAPDRPSLTAGGVEALLARWQGHGLRWLAPGEAAEFELPHLPDDRWTVWAELQAQGTDLAVQRSGSRRKRVLLADMDSTMIAQECVDELAAAAGVGPQVAEITARAMNGELDFGAALLARVALLRGLPQEVAAQVLAGRITLTPGGRELVATMRAHGGYAALVSGGFTVFTGAVAAQLGFDEHRANTLLVDGGRLTGDVSRPILGRQAKVDALLDITARLGLQPQDVLAVGDGANDLGMLELAGTGVALHAKPAVAAQCGVRIHHGDLTALLYLQGYARDEFVSP